MDEHGFDVQPGPIDPTVLHLQAQHVSEHIWDGQPDRILRVRRSHHFHHAPPPDAILPYLREAGFIGLARCGYMPIDHMLITSLVERWRPETHTFHMPQGEMTITMQDVGIQLSLPIHGRAVTGIAYGWWSDLVESLLGITVPVGDRVIVGGRVRMTWLDSHFSVLADDADDETVRRFARAYILRLIGGTLFADRSGSFVHLSHIMLLRDFTEAGRYSWGSAALAYLYKELCKATDPSVPDLGGCSLLLQLWAWDRFPPLAPRVIDPEMPEDDIGYVPLARRWTAHQLTYLESPRHSLRYYRHRLDSMKGRHVVWTPYTEDVLDILPDYCVQGSDVWSAVVPLIYYHVVEWHQPDRVMRQFGLHQSIPAPPRQVWEVHGLKMTGRADIAWEVQHAPYIAQWDNKEYYTLLAPPTDQFDLPDDDHYMMWYRVITRRFITPLTGVISYAYDIAHRVDTSCTRVGASPLSPQDTSISMRSIMRALDVIDEDIASRDEVAPPDVGDDQDYGSHAPRRRRHTPSSTPSQENPFEMDVPSASSVGAGPSTSIHDIGPSAPYAADAFPMVGDDATWGQTAFPTQGGISSSDPLEGYDMPGAEGPDQEPDVYRGRGRSAVRARGRGRRGQAPPPESAVRPRRTTRTRVIQSPWCGTPSHRHH